MNQTVIFWPMIAQIALVYLIYAVVSKKRIDAVRGGTARVSQFRENRVEPEESLFAHNNLVNQFELPVLFYPLCICLFITDGVELFTLILAWLFVASRYIHAWIQITTNRIRHRRPIFILGYFVLAALWISFAIQISGIV